MHQLQPSERTLSDLATEWNTTQRVWNSDACQPTVDFLENPERPTLMLGDHEIPLDDVAIAQLCAFYAIPTAFFGRLMCDEKHHLLNSRIDYTSGEVSIAYRHTGLVDIRKPTQPRLSPIHFIEAAEAIVPSDATILDAWCTADDLRIDVLTANPAEGGVIGGLRLAQNRKQNLAPTVAPFLFHQDTTSIVHITDASLKIDARGLSVDRIAELYAADVLRAEARLTHDIYGLHSLNLQPIGGKRIDRIAEEHGLPARPLADITRAIGTAVAPTMFDLVIAVANAANNPKLADSGHRGARTKLQAIAGFIVTDNAERCDNCQALLAAA